MTQITRPHQCDTHQPFVPLEVQKRKLCASRTLITRHKNLPRNTNQAAQTPAHLGWFGAGRNSERKTLRTYMFDDMGRLRDAKINLETGEVVPHTYKTILRPRPVSRRDPNASDCAPFWMTPRSDIELARQTDEKSSLIDPSRKKLSNPLVDMLKNYIYAEEAMEDFPGFDDILTGVLAIPLGGNTRPLNRNMVFSMLQHLDVVSPHTVREFMECSTSHSEKVAACLRVAVRGMTRYLRDREGK